MSKDDLIREREEAWLQVQKMVDIFHRLPPNLQRDYQKMILDLLEELKELSRKIWQISG